MKQTTIFKLAVISCSIILIVAAVPSDAAGPVLTVEEPVTDQYIVVFLPEAVRTTADGVENESARPSVQRLGSRLARAHRGVMERSFEHALHGAVVRMRAEDAARMAADPAVAFIEQDGWVHTHGTQPNPPGWGLDRVDQRQLPLDSEYVYNNQGAGVDVYIIDSGIRSTHVDFEGRVDTAAGFTTIDDGLGTEDCNGHGTAVASIVAGAVHGVAKGATLHPVRVVGCDGVGTISDLVAGVDWVTAQRSSDDNNNGGGKKPKGKPSNNPQPPAVANISLSSPGSAALDTAVQSSIAAGVTYVVAAGNDATDACGYSPSRLSQAIVVGASDSADMVTSYSNVGPCLDLFAPGASIASAWWNADDSQVVFGGTSAAAPHVTGTVALLLAAEPTTPPSSVEYAIKSNATADTLNAVPLGSPNRLLFAGFAGQDALPTAAFTVDCHPKNGRCTFDGSASSDDGGIVSWEWDLGDGTTDSGETVRHRYTSGSSYTVTLIVTDTASQTGTAQQTIQP